MPARVLILGGIGSGKSTATRWFAAQGAITLSSDDVARDVLEPGTDANRSVLDLWPAVGTNGVIDRSALGRIVFGDPVELAALEAIVHPATRAALQVEIARHPGESVVIEMPILRGWFDASWMRVVIDAPDDLRIERVLSRGGAMTAADVRQVMERQPTRAEWLLASDFAIDNRGDLAALHAQCAIVWERVTGP